MARGRDKRKKTRSKRRERPPARPSNVLPPAPDPPGNNNQNSPEELPTPDGTNTARALPRHYRSRTCRICFEKVYPTLNHTPRGIASVFNPAPTVTYISSDPKAGRFIRPCKCKGSSKYVHEACLNAWRHSDRGYERRNYWECQTCFFPYQLVRLRWARWISSPPIHVLLTLVIIFAAVFVFGFTPDATIEFIMGPLDPIIPLPPPLGDRLGNVPVHLLDVRKAHGPWVVHFLKGMALTGLIGSLKVMFSPLHLFNIQQARLIGSGKPGMGGGNLDNIRWLLALTGLGTILAVGDQICYI